MTPGIVYRFSAWVLAAFPADAAGRRVFDETLADWRREPQVTRGLVAVVRAVAGVAFKEVASVSMGRIWLRVMCWSTAWVLLGLGLSRLAYGWSDQSAYKVAAWSVSGLVFFLPAAILLSFNRKGRLPIIGLCLTSALVGLLLIGWALPAANRVVFGLVVDMPLVAQPSLTGAPAIFQAAWPQLPLDYMSGRYAHDLPRLVIDGPPNGWSGIHFISFDTAFVALCALMPWLASALNGQRAWVRRAGVAFTLLFVLYRGRITDLVAPDWVLWNFVAPWLPVAALTAVLIARGKGLRDPGTSGPRDFVF